MPARRTTRTPRRAIKRVKYSNETFANAVTVTALPLTSEIGAKNYWIPVITPATIAGMRKAKNFTITISCIPPVISSVKLPIIISAMLIYVPEGTSPSPPEFNFLPEPSNFPTPATLNAIYKPDQNVIMSKIGNITETGNITMRNRLARNLNSGDQVGVLLTVFKSINSESQQFAAIVNANYAVTY